MLTTSARAVDDRLVVVAVGGGVGGDRAEQKQGEDVGGADRDPARLEAGAEGDRRQGEPDQHRTGGSTCRDHRDAEQQRDQAPGGAHPYRRVGAGAHEAIGDREAGEAESHRPVHHQPSSGERRDQGDGEDREASCPVAAQAQLHVDQPLLAGGVADSERLSGVANTGSGESSSPRPRLRSAGRNP